MSEAEDLVTRLREQGELALASFTSEELVAVGADSPLPGLVLSERLASMGPIPLTAALSTALRGLVARGFVHPEGAFDAFGTDPDGTGGETVSVPLSGDLAVVVALRRSPALVALLSEPTPTELARRGPLAHRRTDAILHGFTAGEERLSGILEERRSPLGIHSFVLRSLSGETDELSARLQARARIPLEAGQHGSCELALEVAVPGGGGPGGGGSGGSASGGPGRESTSRLVVSLEPIDEPGRSRATVTWPLAPDIPATERLPVGRLSVRLSELLETLWRGNGQGIAHMSAS